MARPAPRQRLTFQDNRLLDPAVQGMLLDRIKQMGGTGIQQDVVWGNVRKDGGYDPAKMAALQGLFRAANARGLRPQVRIMGTPYYQERNQPGVDTTLGATHPNATVMRQYAADMARAFGGQVSKYSVWNEPNVHSFLMNNNPTLAARKYRELYRAAYAGIKASNRNAKVGLGEITSGDPKAGGASSGLGFLKQVLAGKNGLRADYVAMHPYQWSDPSRQPHGMDPGFAGVSNLAAAQAVLREAFARGRLRTATGKRPELTASEYGYKHEVANAAQRKAWLKRSMNLFREAGIDDVNLYQLLPSKQGDYWDSSILGAQGQLPAGYANMLRRRGRR